MINLKDKKVVQDILEVLYNEFEFIESNKESFTKIVFSDLNKTLDSVNDCNVLYESLLKNGQNKLLEYMKKIIDNGQFMFLIKSYFEVIRSRKTLEIQDLINLGNYLEKIKCFLNDTQILFINDCIDEELYYIIETNLEDIQKQNYDFVENNKFLICLIEAYCGADELNNENDTYMTDSTKLFLSEISKFPLLTKEEERQLLIAYKTKKDSKAFEKLVNCNLRLVASIARRNANRGMEFLDLVQEGSLGLMKAIEDFDLAVDVKLGTYATWRIRQTINRAIYNKGHNIRIPVNKIETLTRISKIIDKYMIQYNHQPTFDELHKLSGVNKKEIVELLEIGRIDTISLNDKIGENEDSELISFITDESVDVETSALKNYLKDDIHLVLRSGNLSEREIDVLEYNFGMKEEFPYEMSYTEIGKIYGVSKQCIDVIVNRALKKLRNSTKIKAYKNYISEACCDKQPCHNI